MTLSMLDFTTSNHQTAEKETKMTNLKYSDYVRIIADSISHKNLYICIVIKYHPLSRKYPDYAKKLRKTIKTKLAKFPKNPDGTEATTLISAYLSSGMKVDQVTYRKQWLETIARIHERKGN